MPEIAVTLTADGGAYVHLMPGGSSIVRESVALDELEAADRVPTLDTLTLDLDHYGRLVGIRVAGSPDSVLPPALLDGAREA
ncbi:unannotated protein [freshwater metagenome]|uniref:Unannotated protein n=1 Tax=freshwater metagenome TaxID=449393 RepID=A0A6J7GH16_9ZZZZ|nr:hypothetical protein [Actinomycetota bacterium]